jgi:outer membrane biosynthesis protein TonB
MADDKPGGQGDTKPAGETKPTEQKPTEQKPAEQKPVDTKPEEKPGEQRPAEQKPVEQKPTTETKVESKAPDKYTLKLPEGSKDYLEQADLTQIEKLARAKSWTNEQAQQALDEHADTMAQQSAAFRAVTEADPTYGGDKLEETQKLAKAALDRLRPAGTPRGDAFRKLLTRSGYGNNIEVISMLADLGRQMAEDQPGAGGGGGGNRGGGNKRPAEEVLYGSPKK